MIAVGIAMSCALAAGLAAGRWAVLVPLVLAWPVYFLGLERDWWGSGLGDGWGWALAGLSALSVGAGALGVAARRWLVR